MGGIDMKREAEVSASHIYFLFHDEALLYIGSSQRVSARIDQHIRQGQIPFNNHQVMAVEPDKWLEIEAALIKKHQPPLNRRHTDKWKYARPEEPWFEGGDMEGM
jgi:hypothetical protein